MGVLRDFVLFDKFITPLVLQVLFWAAIVGNLYGTWWLYSHGNWAWVMALVFGTLMIRLIFENFMLRYQTYLCLRDIRERLDEPR